MRAYGSTLKLHRTALQVSAAVAPARQDCHANAPYLVGAVRSQPQTAKAVLEKIPLT